MSEVTTELAPITQRSPMVTPPVMTTLAPHQTLAPTRVGPFEVKPCQGTGLLGIVEAVVGVGDEAAIGEHAVLPDLDESTAATITPRFRKLPAPISILPGAGAVSQTFGLEQDVATDLEPALAHRLEHVAVQRPARERLAAHQLPVDRGPIPRQRVALVEAPLLHPEEKIPAERSFCIAHEQACRLRCWVWAIPRVTMTAMLCQVLSGMLCAKRNRPWGSYLRFTLSSRPRFSP